MQPLANRSIEPESGWRLPIVPPDYSGIVTPSCEDRTQHVIPARVGIGLRIGGEARLCFACGPDGGVYHPDELTMEQVMAKAHKLPALPGYHLIA